MVPSGSGWKSINKSLQFQQDQSDIKNLAAFPSHLITVLFHDISCPRAYKMRTNKILK